MYNPMCGTVKTVHDVIFDKSDLNINKEKNVDIVEKSMSCKRKPNENEKSIKEVEREVIPLEFDANDTQEKSEEEEEDSEFSAATVLNSTLVNPIGGSVSPVSSNATISTSSSDNSNNDDDEAEVTVVENQANSNRNFCDLTASNIVQVRLRARLNST